MSLCGCVYVSYYTLLLNLLYYFITKSPFHLDFVTAASSTSREQQPENIVLTLQVKTSLAITFPWKKNPKNIWTFILVITFHSFLMFELGIARLRRQLIKYLNIRSLHFYQSFPQPFTNGWQTKTPVSLLCCVMVRFIYFTGMVWLYLSRYRDPSLQINTKLRKIAVIPQGTSSLLMGVVSCDSTPFHRARGWTEWFNEDGNDMLWPSHSRVKKRSPLVSFKWKNIFWKINVLRASTVPEMCRISARVHWSYSGSMWKPNTLLTTLGVVGFFP